MVAVRMLALSSQMIQCMVFGDGNLPCGGSPLRPGARAAHRHTLQVGVDQIVQCAMPCQERLNSVVGQFD